MAKQLQFVCPQCGANLDLDDILYADCDFEGIHIECCQECAGDTIYSPKFTVEELIPEIPYLSVKYD